MNPFFIALLAASQFFYSDYPGYNEYYGQIICSSKPRCHDFYTDNGLSVWFTRIKYFYKNKRSTIKLYCLLENKSNDTLLLDRQPFSISSDTSEFILQPGSSLKDGKREKLPDQFYIPPGPDGKDLAYSFEFTSKNKTSRKLMGSDTLRLQYFSGGQTTTVFRFVAVLKIDDTWTKDDIERAYTY